jgi:extracellular solute-binding protein (family 3)
LKVKTIYRKESSPTDAPLRSKEVELVVTPVFTTAERDREFDFSYPILEAGQQVMVRDAGEGTATNPLQDLASLLFSSRATGAAIALGSTPTKMRPPSTGGSGKRLNTASTTLMIKPFFKFAANQGAIVAGKYSTMWNASATLTAAQYSLPVQQRRPAPCHVGGSAAPKS